MRKLPDNQCLTNIFQRSVDRVNEQLHCARLIRPREHQARAWFYEKIIRRLAQPFVIEPRLAGGSLQTANECTQSGIVRRSQNLCRKRVRQRRFGSQDTAAGGRPLHR